MSDSALARGLRAAPQPIAGAIASSPCSCRCPRFRSCLTGFLSDPNVTAFDVAVSRGEILMNESSWVRFVRLHAGTLSFALAAPIAAQQVQPRLAGSRPGSIAGDVYLTFVSGDLKAAAGETVYLLRDTDDFRLARIGFCRDYLAGSKRLKDSLNVSWRPLQDSINTGIQQFESAMNARQYDQLPRDLDSQFVRSKAMFRDQQRVSGEFRKAAVDTSRSRVVSRAVRYTGTGMHAHFQFDSVPPGKYILYADWTERDLLHRWLKYVQVVSGQLLKADLDNDAIVDRLLNCS